MFLMKSQLNGVQLFSTAYLPASMVIVLAAWAPPFVYEQLKRWTNPTLEQKIMSQNNIISKLVLLDCNHHVCFRLNAKILENGFSIIKCKHCNQRAIGNSSRISP